MSEKNRFRFTKASIDALPVPEAGKRPWYWDTEARHLALRVSVSGKAFYHYQWVADKAQQTALGRYPEMTIEQARDRVKMMNGRHAEGENPRTVFSKKKGEQTFESLFQWYYEEEVYQKRSRDQDAMQFRRHFVPLHNVRISKITSASVVALHKQIHDSAGPSAANKAIRLLRAIFNRAIRKKVFRGDNPALYITPYDEQPRDRRLMAGEVGVFFDALDAEPVADIRDFVLLSLFTAARKSNVLAMRWDQIDLAGPTWRIPQTKNGTAQNIKLGKLEGEILTRRKLDNLGASPWVFPGTGKTGHMLDPRKGWMRIIERAGIEDLHIHDLRRSLGSWMVDTGASIEIIGKALHHKSSLSTRIYAQLSQDPVSEAKSIAIDAIMKAAGRS